MNTYITPHFRWDELICPCCNRIAINDQLWKHMQALEVLREQVDFRIMVTSGYRCPEHNANVGGSVGSQHMVFATDVRPKDRKDLRLFNARLGMIRIRANVLGFIGIGVYSTWVHLDMRKGDNVRWTG